MTETQETVITSEVIDQAMTYGEYRKLIDNLLEEGKTTGPRQSEKMADYTRINVHRMNRLDKHVDLTPSLKEQLECLDDEWIWMVLTEAWCGDAAQNIPVIVKMAEVSDNIELKFILRDQHLDIMDEYLTNGGRSIPKLICLDAITMKEIGTWGPRPAEAQEKAMKWKDALNVSKSKWAEKLHTWYADDRTETLQEEFRELIKKWQKST